MRAEDIPELARDSIGDPASVARTLIGMRLAPEVIWTAMALFSVLSTLVIWVTMPGSLMGGLVGGPLFSVFSTMVITALSAVVILFVGRSMGGEGRFIDVLLAETWVLGLRVPILLVTQVLGLAAPGLAAILSLLAGFTLFWISLNFIMVALRLDNLWKSFFVVLIAAVVAAVIMVMILTILGVGPTPETYL